MLRSKIFVIISENLAANLEKVKIRQSKTNSSSVAGPMGQMNR